MLSCSCFRSDSFDPAAQAANPLFPERDDARSMNCNRSVPFRDVSVRGMRFGGLRRNKKRAAH
jgi:hypothetical protein